ncbi:MAG: hypothetical protein COA65_08685 [Rhodospirillaceae bacterium]|nr:MAG: hypothetical protein COA65_08685 [Rhodospirillaceae bacterium]
MILGDLLNSLAKTAGIDEKDENLVKLMAIKEVATAEIADDLGSKIQSSLMTMDAALNNPEIVNKLKAESLNPVDDKLNTLAKDTFGMDDTFIETLKNTKGTYNRMDLFASSVLKAHQTAIKVLEETKAGTTNPEVKSELQGEIDRLNGELSGIKDSTVSSAEHKEMIDGYESLMQELQLKNMFSNYNYAMDVSKDVNIGVASSIFQNELHKRGVELVNENGNLVLKTKLDNGEYTKYFVDNKEITPKDMADRLFAEHKLLKVNGTPEPTTTPVNIPVATPTGSGADPEAVAIATGHVGSIQTLGEAQPA